MSSNFLTRPLRSSRPLELILSRVSGAAQTGESSHMAQCPAHDDSTASLSFRELPDRRVLIHCHAGCSTPEVMDGMGLTMAHLFPIGLRPSSAARVVPQTPTYRPLPWNAQGRLYAAHKALIDEPEIMRRLLNEKGISAHVAELAGLGWDAEKRELLIAYLLGDKVTPAALDEWKFKSDRDASGRPSKAMWRHPRPLFVAYRVLAELEDETLLVAEGPLDALTACSKGYPAVAAPSASDWKRDAAEWIAELGYERHIVVGDCDPAGRKFADRASRDLAEHHLHVGVLDLDVSRDDGFDLGEFLLEGRHLP